MMRSSHLLVVGALVAGTGQAFVPRCPRTAVRPRLVGTIGSAAEPIDAVVTLPEVEAALERLRELAEDCGLCGLSASNEQKRRMTEAIENLVELAGPATASAESINGRWTLLYSDAPDIVVSLGVLFFSWLFRFVNTFQTGRAISKHFSCLVTIVKMIRLRRGSRVRRH